MLFSYVIEIEFFETFISYKKAFHVLEYSVIPRLKIFCYSAYPPFLRFIILLISSRYRILQLARLANLAAIFGITGWFSITNWVDNVSWSP